MKHIPIGTTVNNRYRGPVETFKINSFYKDIEYNINYLKKLYQILEERSADIDNNIKNRIYSENCNTSNIIDFIEMAVQDLG